MLLKQKIEPTWHVELAVVAAIALQFILNDHLIVGPKYLMAGLEVLLLIGLALTKPRDQRRPIGKSLRRASSLLLIALITFANITSLFLVVSNLLNGTHRVVGHELIVSAFAIYLTNIIIFGLWYWELDGSFSPRHKPESVPADFLFPQMTAPPDINGVTNWRPTFFDYLYVSVTNGTAFSPTDAMPLTHRAKLLMTLQSLTSLVTIALVAARAINILV